MENKVSMLSTDHSLLPWGHRGLTRSRRVSPVRTANMSMSDFSSCKVVFKLKDRCFRAGIWATEAGIRAKEFSRQSSMVNCLNLLATDDEKD